MTKCALITGSTSGIGREIALRLLKEGMSIVVNGSNENKLANFPSGQNIYKWNCDLSNSNDAGTSLAKFMEGNGINIDCLVYSAGVDMMCPIRSVRPEIYKKIFNVNFFSAVEIVKCLLSKKINNSTLRSVVFISSNASGLGAKGMSMYVASKSALDGFMKSAAVECAPRVRFNSVLPGAVRTEMTAATFDNEEVAAKLLALYPMGEGRPSNVAEVINFLLSENASWVNGQQIVVDGGRSINISP
jgi:NAD(P)-dependent dehydrogenase (short-subunit alcohol dehydrogenase family)